MKWQLSIVYCSEDFTSITKHLQSMSLELCRINSSVSKSGVIKHMMFLSNPATEDKTFYHKGEKEVCDIKLSNGHSIYTAN